MKSNQKRSLYLVGILLLVAALACRFGVRDDRAANEGNPGGSSAAAERDTINVAAEEFKFTLDAAQAEAGTLTFIVRNEGHMPHDFAISGAGVDEKTSMLDPGETATLEVTLEPGTFGYACTVPGHAMLGMNGTFTVTP